MQMHVGAVEQRVAFAENGNRPASLQMRGNGGCGDIVEAGDLALVVVVFLVDLGGNRIVERQLDEVGFSMPSTIVRPLPRRPCLAK